VWAISSFICGKIHDFKFTILIIFEVQVTGIYTAMI
jgi:hypothetical protein